MTTPKEMRIYSRSASAVFRKTDGPFGGLSNMSPGYPVRVNGVLIPTVEALYQACRFPHRPDVQKLIIDQHSPMTAKMVSKPYREESRPDWERVRVKIMRWCLRLKLASHWPKFSRLLLSTGDQPIVEDSRKDDFWGAMEAEDKRLEGQNILGRLLMELREAIKQGAELRRVEPPAIPNFVLFGEPLQVVDFRADKSAPVATPTPVEQVEDELPLPLFAKASTAPSKLPQPQASSLPLREQRPSLTHGLNPYPEYTDSGLPWLGKVPSHWRERRLDRLFDLRKERPLPEDQRITGYLSGRVTLRTNVQSNKIKGVIKDGGWQRVHPGDFAISGMNAHLGGMGVSDSLGKCSPIYLVLKPKPGTNAHFVSHAVRHIAHMGALKSFVNTIRFNSADFKQDALKLFRILLPDEDEQSKIVAFVDHANVKIDEAIRAKKKLIALLNEQKQAIIHRAVTRGLNPNVTLKPSGIPWLGDIPKNWDVRRIKYLLREVDCRSKTGSEPLLSMRMHHGLVLFSEHFSRPPQAATLVGFKIVRPGQFVVNRMQAGNGVIYASKLTGLVSPDYAVFDPIGKANVDFLGELFRSRKVRAKFRAESKGLGTGSSGFLRLYNDRLGAIHVALPPRPEQEEILLALANELKTVNKSIELAEREIQLLREYRTRLVAEVVTGKLDVRAAAAKLPVASSVDAQVSQLAEEENPEDENEVVETEG